MNCPTRNVHEVPGLGLVNGITQENLQTATHDVEGFSFFAVHVRWRASPFKASVEEIPVRNTATGGDLMPIFQGPAVVRLALDEVVDDAPAEVLGPIQRVVIGSGQRRVGSLPGFVRAILARVHGRVRSAAAGVLRADPDHAPLAIRAFILDGRLRRPPPRAAHRT